MKGFSMDVKLPELGEGIDKAVVSMWYVKIGDRVSEDDDIVELVTDKATFNVPAPCSGVLKEMLVHVNQEAAIGQTLGTIEG